MMLCDELEVEQMKVIQPQAYIESNISEKREGCYHVDWKIWKGISWNSLKVKCLSKE